MMEFEKIMHEITSGLSGDGKKDIKYLMEQAEKYKNHEMGKEIVRAIGRLIFKCAPEDKQAEVNRGIQNDLTSWESVLVDQSAIDHRHHLQHVSIRNAPSIDHLCLDAQSLCHLRRLATTTMH